MNEVRERYEASFATATIGGKFSPAPRFRLNIGLISIRSGITADDIKHRKFDLSPVQLCVFGSKAV